MNQIRKRINKLGMISILSIPLLISPSCEPPPKMIGYGSNEFGQLNFEGTNWQDQRLAEGYTSSWAGGNFSIALYNGPTIMTDSGFICKGDNTFGQCDIPDSLMSASFINPMFYDLSLGMNHGMAWVDTSFSGNYGTNLYLWGRNDNGQATLPELPDSSRIIKMAAGGNHNIIYIGDVTSVIDTVYYPGTATLVITNPQILVWGDNSYGQCDIPARFQNLSDSLVIQNVYAGENHTIITYDSLGVFKMAAWGDNRYGQSVILTESELNGDKTLQELHCGRDHNVAVFVNYENDISEELLNGDGYIDSLFVISYDQSYDYGPTLPSHHTVSLMAWGDNTFGQCDIPTLSGLFEDIDVGGYHNSVAVTDGSMLLFDEALYDYYGYYNYLHSALGRSIVGWGKNDQGQTSFPLEYIVNWNTNGPTGPGPGPGPGPAPANSPPILTLGGDHTFVRGSHVYRAPSIDYTFPDQFNGAMGDTLYQTITLYGIGPDTVNLDSIFILTYSDGYVDTIETHPFFVEQPELDYVLFDDSLTFQIYCIYDSTHMISETANLFIHSDGWWADTTVIALNSFFGPVIEVNSFPDIFLGDYGETVIKSVEFHNVGNATAYLDSIQLPEYFEYEPFGEDNFILPNDSLEIYLYITFPEYPMYHSGNGVFYFSNYNTIAQNINLNATRYMRVGDNLNLSNYFNYNIGYCGQDILDDGVGNLSLSTLSEFASTNVHYLDFGYFDSSGDIQYGVQLDTISTLFQDNPYFASLIGIGLENWLPGNPGNNTFYQECDSLLSLFEQRENKLVFQDVFFHQHFKEDVQSVVLDMYLNIIYMGQFDQDSITTHIEQAIENCGLGCLSNTSLTLGPDTLQITVPQNSTTIDTVRITNNTEYTLDYYLDVESGNQLVSSVLFHNGSGGNDMTTSFETISSPATISMWLKPLETNWSQDNSIYTNFLSPVDTNSSQYWEIIFDSNIEHPRIGWKDSEIHSLSDVAILPTEWYHCTFVHDLPNEEIILYVNGVEQFRHIASQDIQANSPVGINMIGPGRYTGFLAQTSIWNVALSQSEITTLNNLGINADHLSNQGNYESSDDLMVYWKMNEQSGYSIMDYSGNGFHAEVSGNQDIWRTELIVSDQPWLNLMSGGGSQTIGSMVNEVALVSVNTSSLEIGDYTGVIQLIPDYNPSAMINNIVMLTIIEELATSNEVVLPVDYALHQNYPNPFNPITDIKYDLPDNEEVLIVIYDIMGRQIRSLLHQKQLAGYHQVQWDGRNDFGETVASGMYVYALKAGKYLNTKKMVMLK